jgi:O-antigen/teichoic acid export membrane protein
MNASDEEMQRPNAAILVEQVDAAEVPDAEVAEGAAAPMVGSFVATGIIQAMQAVTGVVLARVLGPSDRGELAALILWPTMISVVGSLGIAQSSTYHAARAKHLGEVVGGALMIVFLDSLLLVAIGWAILPLVLGGHDSHVVHEGQIFLSAFIPLSLLAQSMMSILNGSHRFVWFQSLRVVMIGTILIGIALLAATGNLTVRSAAGAYVFAYLLAAVIALAVVLRSVHVSRVSLTRVKTRALLAFGLKSQLSQSMWSLNERADQLVISIFFSATSLGLYVVAVTLTSLTTLIGFSFAVVALPLIAPVDAKDERRRVARLIVSATLVCGFLVSVPIFILEPVLIKFFFGAEFVDAAGVGRVLLVAAIVFGLNRVMEALLQAVGRPLESSIGEAVALGVTAVGLGVLLPTAGIMGAGITSLIAYSASSAFMVRRASRALDISPLTLVIPERGTIGKIRSLGRFVPGFAQR